MTRRMWATAGLLVAYAVVVGLLTVGMLALTAPRQPAEDDPGWDCRTMGNHQCCPTSTP